MFTGLKFAVRQLRPLAVVVLVLACGGVAIALASGGPSSVHACYAKHGGALRVITHGRCKRSERAIAWNVTGPAGKAGSAGKTGGNGATGASGAAGATGTTGTTGAVGTARAYAHVITTGTGAPKFDSARTKGFASVAYASPNGETDGTYCLTADSGISAATTAAVVAPDYADAYAGTAPLAYLDVTDSDCPVGKFEVQTYFAGSPPTAAHTIDFNIVVP